MPVFWVNLLTLLLSEGLSLVSKSTLFLLSLTHRGIYFKTGEAPRCGDMTKFCVYCLIYVFTVLQWLDIKRPASYAARYECWIKRVTFHFSSECLCVCRCFYGNVERSDQFEQCPRFGWSTFDRKCVMQPGTRPGPVLILSRCQFRWS